MYLLLKNDLTPSVNKQEENVGVVSLDATPLYRRKINYTSKKQNIVVINAVVRKIFFIIYCVNGKDKKSSAGECLQSLR
jgi:hypothetical protein